MNFAGETNKSRPKLNGVKRPIHTFWLFQVPLEDAFSSQNHIILSSNWTVKLFENTFHFSLDF